MNQLINKLERFGQSGSLNQQPLDELLNKSGMTETELNKIKSIEIQQYCILAPDDDED